MPDPDELTKAKEPFVLRGYASAFEGATRNMNAITTIRGWQITAVGGLTLFTKRLPWYIGLAVVLFAWAALVALECNEQLFLESANDHAERYDKRLEAKTIGEWQVTIRDWTFGSQEVHTAVHDKRWRLMGKVFLKDGVWPWQVIVLVALVGGLLLRPYLPMPGKP